MKRGNLQTKYFVPKDHRQFRMTHPGHDAIKLFYRPGTVSENSSDENAIEEVLERRCYRRARSNFDVFTGEHWLDLGANIGAFAVYCLQQGATAECYEPDLDNFKILQMNVGKYFDCHRTAVSAEYKRELVLRGSPNPLNRYRGTVCGAPKRYVVYGRVPNEYAGALTRRAVDGVKMDIEGAECAILDNWLLPKCQKLVLEYHTSRDSSISNLTRRLQILKDHFVHVKYPKLYDDAIAANPCQWPPRFDQIIFAWEPKQ